MDRTQEIAARAALKFNVISRRTQMQLSQSELAKRSSVSHLIVSNLELGRGYATLDVLGKIASALEVSVADLFTQHARSSNSVDDIERERQTTTKPTLVPATRSGVSNMEQKFKKCANSGKVLANDGRDATVLSLSSDSTMTTVDEVTEQLSHEVRQPSSTITSLSRVRLLKGRDRVLERLHRSGF